MHHDDSADDSRRNRISELKEVLFLLNDTMHDRFLQLEKAEDSIFDRVRTGKMSMNPKVVENFRLADRVLARSLRVNIRIHQRNILYFKMRKRRLAFHLSALGQNIDEFEKEWKESLLERQGSSTATAEADPDDIMAEFGA